MNSWFNVGEEVLVITKSYPEINGEYRIKAFISKIEALNRAGIPLTFDRVLLNDTYCVLENLFIKDKINTETFYDFVPLSCVYKKHQGCGDNFQSMMSKLNTKIVEEL